MLTQDEELKMKGMIRMHELQKQLDTVAIAAQADAAPLHAQLRDKQTAMFAAMKPIQDEMNLIKKQLRGE